MNKQEYKEVVNKWIETEKEKTCSRDSQERYEKMHKRRFSILYKYITQNFPNKELKVLDVGRSHFTKTLQNYYKNVTTIGFAPDYDEGGHRLLDQITCKHLTFDLKQAKNVDIWPEEKFDLIIFAEVIEHLSEAPEFALLMFHSLLTNNGHLLCTTPNAAALFRRYKLFFGNQPYSKIRYFSNNPGHYREYTKRELYEMGEKCGFKTVNHRYTTFHKHTQSLKAVILDLLSSIIPAFKWYQMILWKKNEILQSETKS
ncbi:MAG: hypothetical protein DRH79_01960 [Candidatus Cloacimonadota bacterium]|nr:MAG: hypothetical protein DRH79_01960 [Candidatus Cloacimonadota bacterium]